MSWASVGGKYSTIVFVWGDEVESGTSGSSSYKSSGIFSTSSGILAKGLAFIVVAAEVVIGLTNFVAPPGAGLIFETLLAGVASPGAPDFSSSFFKFPRAVIGLAVGAFFSSAAAGAVFLAS